MNCEIILLLLVLYASNFLNFDEAKFCHFTEKEEKYAPEFIKTPAEVVARENDRSQFLVKVIGMPSPTGIRNFIHDINIFVVPL